MIDIQCDYCPGCQCLVEIVFEMGEFTWFGYCPSCREAYVIPIRLEDAITEIGLVASRAPAPRGPQMVLFSLVAAA